MRNKIQYSRVQELDGDVHINVTDSFGTKYQICQDEFGNVTMQCRDGGIAVKFEDLPEDLQALITVGVAAAPCT